jgi:outer membrane protein TolC
MEPLITVKRKCSLPFISVKHSKTFERFRALALAAGGALLLATAAQAAAPFDSIAGARPAMPGTVQTQSPPIRIEGPLTLARAVETALVNNPEVVATGWDMAAAEAKLDAARAGRRPSLSAEGSAQRFLDDQRLIPTRYNGEPGVFDDDMYRGDLVLRLPLFTGGRLTHEVRAAELIRLAEEKRLTQSRAELVFNVSSTFYTLLSQREVIRSLEFSATAMEEHRKQVSALLAEQKAARVELLRTEVRLADLRQALVRERNVLAVQKRLLVNLMGVDTAADRLEIEGTLSTEPANADREVEDLMVLALNRRSDYLSAQARLEAQSRRVDVAKAGQWPTVSLLVSYGVRGTATGKSEDAGAAGVGVSVPLFDGGRVAAQVGQETAALAAARERLRKMALQIRRDVETAVLEIHSAMLRIEATRQAIEQARESLRIERLKYDLGSGSMTDVLDAQSALLQSETNSARALADYHIATAKLKLATGEEAR